MKVVVIIILIYLILFSIAAGYGAWWLYQAINTISTNLRDLQSNKHARVITYLENIKFAINTFKGDLTTAILNTDRFIKSQTETESNSIKQLIMAQFSSQTSRLIEEAEVNLHTLSSMVTMAQNMHSQTIKGIKDNYARIDDSTTRIGEYIQQLSSDEQMNAQQVQARIDKYHVELSDFSIKIERLLKEHKDTLSSTCNQIIANEKELHQKTEYSFNSMNDNLSKYLSQLEQLSILYNNLQELYTKLLGEEEKICNQESSLADMVSRHSQIFEITAEMNKTSREIFEFMKLYLIQSTIDNFKK